MSDSMVSVSLTPRGKKVPSLPKNVSTFKGAPLSELTSILSKKTGLSVHRFRLTDTATGKVLTAQDKIDSDVTLSVKDLGPQISWQKVFIIEYVGPLLIHPAIFFAYQHVSGPRSSAQWLTLIMITLHFVKREYETLYVHRFSSATMPLFNVFKNSAHYWLLGGAFLAVVTYSDMYSKETYEFPRYPVLLYIISELLNFKTHAILRDLRPVGTTQRQIPRGIGFDLVTCPNYFFEILAWIGISTVTQSWASWIFSIVAAVQMWFWSVKKHKRYRKEFKDYPKDRKIMIPYLA